MADDLNIVYRIAADISGLEQGVKRAADATEGLQSAATKVGVALAGMFTLTAVEEFAGTVLSAASAFQKMADQTGLSTDEVQKLNFVAGQTDVSVESLVSAVQNLQQRLGDDNSGAAGAMRKLGINAEAFAKLSTYEQVASLSESLRNIKDPTEQAALAAAVFGKNWKEILPAVKAGMKEVGDQAPIMSEATVKALDRIDDALKKARATAVDWGGSVVLALEGAGFAVGDFLSQFNPEHWGVTTSQLQKLQVALNDPDGAIRAFGASTEAAKKLVHEGMDPLKKILPPTAAELVDFNRQLEKHHEESLIAAETAKKAAEALQKWNQSIEDTTIHMNLSVFTLHRFGAIELPNVASGFEEARKQTEGWIAPLQDATGDIEQLQRSGRFAAAALVQLSGAIQTLPPGFRETSAALKEYYKEQEDAATATERFIQHLHTGFKDVAAILDNISGKWAEFGAIVARTADAVITRLEEGDWVGAIVAGVSGAIAAIKKLFTSAEKQVNPVRQAFIDAAGGLDALNRKAHDAGITLDHLLDARTPEAYKKAIDELTKALQFQDDAMQFLDDTVKKYGFTIEELGPKFSQQQLTKQAFDLEKEFRALEAAGIDVGTISEHMKDAINDYLHAALKTGAEVPASMKEILRQLANMGLLTDENGNAITDLEAAGIHFSETLDEQFKDLIKTIHDLIDAISRGLGTAISNIPNPVITGTVRWDVPDPNMPNPYMPDVYRPPDVLQFATGGMVPGGPDTVPALLSPGELILTQGQQQNLKGVSVGSVVVNMAIDPATNQQQLADQFKEVLRTDATVYEAVAVVAQRTIRG